MPDGWAEYPFAKLASISFSGVDKKSVEGEQSVKLCNYLDVIRNITITPSLPFMHATASEGERGRFQLELDDVVFTKDSEVPEEIAEPSVVVEPVPGVICGYHLGIARPRTGKASGRFLAHLMRLPEIRKKFASRANGVTRFGLTIEATERVPLTVPSLPEQRRIAAVLDAWDEAIALNEQLVEAKRRRRDGMRQRLLAPAFRHTPACDGWSRKSITDIADIRGGGTPSSAEPAYWDGDVAWCTPTDLTGLPTRFLGSTTKTITQDGLKASAASVLPAGSVILCSRASVGECAISTIPMATNQGFQSLVPHRAGDASFLYHLMRHAKSQLLRISAGSTFLEFGRNEFRRMKAVLPNAEMRTTIAAALDALTDEIDLLAARTDLLRAQKRGLMQRLLTGEVRVPESVDALLPPPREAAE